MDCDREQLQPESRDRPLRLATEGVCPNAKKIEPKEPFEHARAWK